ncbi:MAG: hypothetical protein KDA85_16220 [Planctomycetaceae bacterium]|nr:hypothetical protein [Planctomycetaceae bacterium]
MRLGGSLLHLPDLVDRLSQVLGAMATNGADGCETSAPLSVLLIVGGGPSVDQLRSLQMRFGGSDEQLHWQAVEVMSHHAALLARLLPRTRYVSSREEALLAWRSGQTAVLNVNVWLRAEEAHVQEHPPSEGSAVIRLPHDWTCTSDSIAAWVAQRWPAQSLVLLKSAAAVSGMTSSLSCPAGTVDPVIRTWAEAGIVDSIFPQVARGLPQVELINLRAC